MANLDEDVIELGSSDDETEPAPKKKKSMPNAMVHIPSKLPGLTIKPATNHRNKLINPVSIAKGNIGKAVTVTKVPSGSSKLSNPFARKIVQNGNSVVRKQTAQIAQSVVNPAMKILPALKNMQKIQPMPIGKVPNAPIKIVKLVPTNQHPIQPPPPGRLIPGSLAPGRLIPGSLSPGRFIPGSLPPGITVKRTTQLQTMLKRNMKPNPVSIQKRKASRPVCKKASGEMVCVDLDDDEVAPKSAGPQWYLRPEEQENKDVKLTESPNKSTDLVKPSENIITNEMETTGESKETTGESKEATDLEEQNNREPDDPKFIEITIEDSPAKPQPKSKRTCEVADLAITIDDSPVKAASEKPAPSSGSDGEITTAKEKQSKKKLEYPKAAEECKTVEIEIELTPLEDKHIQNDDKKQDGVEEMEVVEIEESPLKSAETFLTSTPKKKTSQPHKRKMIELTDKNPNPKPKSKLIEDKPENVAQPKSKLNKYKTVLPTPGEFHPTYQSFIDLCFRLENSEDMSKIVEKKIKAYYREVPKEYTESEMFIDMVSSKISAMKAGPEKMYLYIKDVVDELNLQRKIAKSQPHKVVTVNEEQDKFLYGEDSEFDSKRQRQIRMLDKTLKKLHRAIQKLEEQEVDFDDEEDSVYLLTERYKERMIRVHAKFCQLTNTKMPSEPRVQIDVRPGQPKGPAKRLEKWINKKVPIGTPLPFPDFHDVLRCVRDANKEDNLCWNEADVMEEARDLFTRCGKKLQRRRQENEWRLAASRIQSELDPAEGSADLKKALEDNRRVASKRESEVFNKYADRQNQLKLEAVEIGDKEAEESPVETDDEEPTEESICLTKKRKEGLKKLLKKKSKKGTKEKEQSVIDTKLPENVMAEVEEAEKTDNKESSSKGDKTDENKEKATLTVKEPDPLSFKQSNTKEDPLSTNKVHKSDFEKVHSLSDDSNKIDSDIDELHLLQKLHSDAFDSSTLESSDSESPIAISDTLSSSDNRKQASDVISIENSSYSESENNEQDYEIMGYLQKKVVTESVNIQTEIECSNAGVERKINKSNNEEFNESVEDILLASSDDEANNDKNDGEDPISIDDTNVKQSKDNTKKLPQANSGTNADTTDASSMESVEMTSKSMIQYESSEDASIPSTEDVDDDHIMNAAEVTTINSVEMVEDDMMTTNAEENAQNDVLASDKPALTVDDKLTKSNEDEAMISFTENTEIPDEVNNINSVEDRVVSEVENNNSEVSTKLTVSVKDKVTTNKPDENTSKVNSEVNTKSAVINQVSDYTENIAD